MPTAHESLDEIYWNIRQLGSEGEKLAYLEELAARSPEQAIALQELLSQEKRAEKLFGRLSQGAKSAFPDGLVRDGAAIAGYLSTGEIGEKKFVGPYRLLEPIGEGGMGIVYLVQQTEPVRRKVALKVIKPGMDSRQVIARFEAERQALAMMEHPNIAKVLDAGTTDSGLPYFVMELVRGIAITDYCDRARMTLRQRLELMCDACGAIQHAHNKGIIHRDIKPSNVLITEHDGTPTLKVIDFGVAKALTDNLTDKTLFTGVFQMIGTPLYMSPEQGALSNSDVDVRSDVYSLGVMLYELVSGKLPIDRETANELSFEQLRKRICESEPPKPSRRLSTLKEDRATIANNRRVDVKNIDRLITSELDWIVMKAIAKDRSQRYQSARELSEDVQRHLAGDAVLACPPSISYRLRTTFRQHRVAAAFLMLLTVSVFAVIVGTMSQAIRARRAEKLSDTRLAAITVEQEKTQRALNQAQSAVALQRSLRDRAETSELESKWSLYVARLYPMKQALAERDTGRLYRLLKESTPGEAEPDYRGWEWYYLQDQVNAASKRVVIKGGAMRTGLAWSAKRRLLAVALREKGHIAILDGDTFETKTTIQIERGVYKLAFSPSGIQLAIGTELKDVVIVNVDEPQQQTVYSPFTETKVSGGFEGKVRIDWSSDENRLATVLHAGDVSVINLVDGKITSVRRPVGSVSVSLDWHPDKPWLAVGHRWGERTIYDLEGDRQWSLSRESVAFGKAIQWSPSGQWLATVEEADLRIVNSNFENHARLKGHSSDITSILWIDDSTVVTGSEDHSIRVWDIEKQEAVDIIRGHPRPVGAIRIDTESNRIFSSGGANRLLVSDLRRVRTFQMGRIDADNASARALTASDSSSTKNFINGLDWSSDGTRIAAAGEVFNLSRWSGSCSVFEANTARQISAWETGLCKGLCWTLDGLALHRMASRGRFHLDDAVTGLTHESQVSSPSAEPIAVWNQDRSRVVRNFDGKPLVQNARTLVAVDQSNDVIAAFKGDSSLQHASWNPKGTSFVAIGHGFGGLVKDDLSVVKLLGGIGNASNAFAADWHPSGRLFAVGKDTGSINLFDSRDGSCLTQLGGHNGVVTGLDFSPDGRRLASCASDGTVVISDSATGDELLVLTVPGIRRFSKIQWSPDGLQLAAGTGTREIVVWGRSSQQCTPQDSAYLKTGRVIKTLDDGEIDSNWIQPVTPLPWRRWYSGIVDTLGKPDQGFKGLPSFQKLQPTIQEAIQNDELPHLITAWRCYANAIQDDSVAIGVIDELLGLIETQPGHRVDQLRNKIRLMALKVNRLVSMESFDEAMTSVKESRELSEQLVRISGATNSDWRLWRRTRMQAVEISARGYEQFIDDSTSILNPWAERLERELDDAEKSYDKFPSSARWMELVETDDSSARPETASSWTARLIDRTVRKEVTNTGRSRLVGRWADRFKSRYYVAVCRAAEGNNDAYRQACRAMISEYMQSDSLNDLAFTAWTCALLPDALDDYATGFEITDKIERLAPDDIAIRECRAALLYRAGELKEARKVYRTLLDAAEEDTSLENIWAFLAMIEFRLGNQEDAERWLAKAEQHIAKLKEDEAAGDVSLTWDRRIILRLFRDEAAELIGEKGGREQVETEPKKKNSPNLSND